MKSPIYLHKGKEYAIRLEYFQNGYNSDLRFSWLTPGKNPFKEAIELAEKADVVIFVGGISPGLEGEEMSMKYEGFRGGDRTNIELPEVQKELIKKLHATGTPVILVLLNGSALAINWENKHLPAILEAWYPGEEGGTAIADVLFGDYNPSGRLPITFYRSVNDLPPFEDYNMKGKTYRFFKGKVLYPFGFGLSYTQFEYTSPVVLRLKISPEESTQVSVEVTNLGEVPGYELVQLYIKDLESQFERPLLELKGMKRVYLDPGEKELVTFNITPDILSVYDIQQKEFIVNPGAYEVIVGRSSADWKKCKLDVEAGREN